MTDSGGTAVRRNEIEEEIARAVRSESAILSIARTLWNRRAVSPFGSLHSLKTTERRVPIGNIYRSIKLNGDDGDSRVMNEDYSSCSQHHTRRRWNSLHNVWPNGRNREEIGRFRVSRCLGLTEDEVVWGAFPLNYDNRNDCGATCVGTR